MKYVPTHIITNREPGTDAKIVYHKYTKNCKGWLPQKSVFIFLYNFYKKKKIPFIGLQSFPAVAYGFLKPGECVCARSPGFLFFPGLASRFLYKLRGKTEP